MPGRVLTAAATSDTRRFRDRGKVNGDLGRLFVGSEQRDTRRAEGDEHLVTGGDLAHPGVGTSAQHPRARPRLTDLDGEVEVAAGELDVENASRDGGLVHGQLVRAADESGVVGTEPEHDTAPPAGVDAGADERVALDHPVTVDLLAHQ